MKKEPEKTKTEKNREKTNVRSLVFLRGDERISFGPEAPFTVSGVPFFDKTGRWERLPPSVREAIPSLSVLGRHTPGARVAFRTDASEFSVSVTLRSLTVDVGMSLWACQSVAVTVGEHKNAELIDYVSPPDYGTRTFEKTICKEPVTQEVTLWLPRNEEVESIGIRLPHGASVEKPAPYRFSPVLFYGSSIT